MLTINPIVEGTVFVKYGHLLSVNGNRCIELFNVVSQKL